MFWCGEKKKKKSFFFFFFFLKIPFILAYDNDDDLEGIYNIIGKIFGTSQSIFHIFSLRILLKSHKTESLFAKVIKQTAFPTG